MNEEVTTKIAGTLEEGKWANMHEQSRRVYDVEGIAPTMHTCGGGSLEPKILDCSVLVSNNTKQGYDVATEGDGIDIANPSSKTRRGRVQHGLSQTLTTGIGVATITRSRIRKLTERECFRLMGVDDTDIDKIQASGISRSQQYKMAGNSIVVDVLAAIFDKMLVNTESDDLQLKLF